QGSQACAALTQAAADAVNGRMNANNAYEKQPESVSGLSCLDKYFSGTGLNLISNIANPGALVDQVVGQVEGEICSAAQSEWNNTVGAVQQCGLSLNGVNVGLGLSTGGGMMCPSLSFGGNGPQLGAASLGNGDSNGYLRGEPRLPTGYTSSTSIDGVF
ncbi:hypothetical protein AD945_00120, partial [Gluconobacter albidus]